MIIDLLIVTKWPSFLESFYNLNRYFASTVMFWFLHFHEHFSSLLIGLSPNHTDRRCCNPNVVFGKPSRPRFTVLKSMQSFNRRRPCPSYARRPCHSHNLKSFHFPNAFHFRCSFSRAFDPKNATFLIASGLRGPVFGFPPADRSTLSRPRENCCVTTVLRIQRCPARA